MLEVPINPPVNPSTTTPGTDKYLNLNKLVATWRVYSLSRTSVIGNEVGF